MIEITSSNIFMIIGFLLSLYACVSNDVIQTLGTFLSTTKERPVWQVWLFTGSILVITFTVGWIINNGDMAFGLLDRVPYPERFYWWHICATSKIFQGKELCLKDQKPYRRC